MIPFTPPKFKEESFNCPHCNAYAHQIWHQVHFQLTGGFYQVKDLQTAFCSKCKEYSVWRGGRMLFPEFAGVMPPNVDLRQDIKDDYKEAGTIVGRSPRGSSALLRLCIQKLCQQLGLPGKDLDDDIGTLVKNGLPATIQKALDLVRIIGNNAVHPGVLDIKDDTKVASKLFELVNHIAYSMITQPKEIEGLYAEKIPQPQKEAIEKRTVWPKRNEHDTTGLETRTTQLSVPGLDA